MSHARTQLSLSLVCLFFWGCTQLDDPNQYFPLTNASGGSSGSTSASAGTSAGGANAGGSSSVASGGSTTIAGASLGGSAGQTSAGAGGSSGGGGQNCEDPSGFHGLGCYSCAPSDILTLENACSTSTCTLFDDKRLSLLGADGKLPDLPAPGAGGAGGNAGSAGAGGSTSTGHACADLASTGTVVYITGSSASKPFLQQIAQQLVSSGIYLVYTSTGSCVGVDAIVNGTPATTGPAPAPATSATYWDSSSSTGVACDLPPEGVTVDIGASDVFAQSCPGFELTDLDGQQIRDAHGPIQTMTFVVPSNSMYTEISSQAAYFVFGFGKDGGVLDPSNTTPIWNNEDYLFQRSAASGTQAMLSAAIGVPPGAWHGKKHGSSDDVSADLQMAGQAPDTGNLAIGILAADYIDSKNLRAQLHVLALQDSAQNCAVYPDSTSGAHDKRNVRDGHYPVWGPLHLLYKVDQLGNPLNPSNRQAVTDIVGYLSGTKALPNGVQLLDVYAQSGLIPECAMHVTRTKDGGNITPFSPASPCSCIFELKATGATSCASCKVQGDCTNNQTCSQGYCEG
jgi:hypothetical protein